MLKSQAAAKADELTEYEAKYAYWHWPTEKWFVTVESEYKYCDSVADVQDFIRQHVTKV